MESDATAGETEADRVDGPVDAEAPGDGGSPSSEATVDEVDHVLDQVELALARLDDGTYGVCESCGAPIDDAHLAELPTAQTCPGCLSAISG
jgi:RNA polymerase-binding transcription factor DksA